MPLVLFSFERSEIDEVEGAVKSAANGGHSRTLSILLVVKTSER